MRGTAFGFFLRQPLAMAGALLVLVFVALALFAPLLPLPDPNETRLENRIAAPLSEDHLLGSDLLGRDILSRLIWGTRTSLAVALAATLAAAIVGSLLGLLSGYFGRKVDWVLMRGIDTLMAFPYLLLALGIVAVLGPGLMNALIAIAIVNIPFFARTVRGATLGIMAGDFVSTARLGGRGHVGILFGEIFPNVLPVIIITMSTTLGWMILETAGLSFLGLGAQPPQADLGSMLADGRLLLLIEPHLALLPGVVIFLLVLGINLAGDGLRDALDPRLSGGGIVPAPGASTPVEREDAGELEKADSGDAAEAEELPVLDVRGLRVEFQVGGEWFRAVDGVDLRIPKSGALGLVGESGSGKSVTALSLLRLLPGPPARIAGGRALFGGRDLFSLSAKELREVRGNRIACIFQDPLGTLNPVHTVGRQISECILLHRGCTAREADQQSLEWLERLAIPNAKKRMRSYPHELSGGMRQRVGIAMAMANEPELIIADEPTTALDVTVQKSVVGMLRDVLREQGTALLFISHDLALVSGICERIAVLYAGRIMESGFTEEVLGRPAHPYTQRLLECLPLLDRERRELRPIEGTPPALSRIPKSCAFADRCERVQPECREDAIPMVEVENGDRRSRCLFSEEVLREGQAT